MPTILASWELGRGYGHLSALAPAARALRALGVETVLAAREPATAARLPDAPFASVIAAPRFQRAAPPAPTLTYATVIGDGGLNDPASAEALVRAWLDIFAVVKPVALLAEHAPASILAAHVAGLPVARLGMGFTVPPAVRPLPSLLPWAKASEAERCAADEVADTVVRQICRAFGAPLLDGLSELQARAPDFLATWPELDIYGVRTGTTYYGPLGGFRGTARPGWPPGDGPRTLVYLSAGNPHAPALAEALTELGWPTLWHGASAPAAPPANIAVSPEPFDMPALLADSAIHVGHGGHASLCDAMRAGRPVLMLPDTLETLLLAARVAAQGLGGFVRGSAESEALAGMLRAIVADSSMRDAGSRVRNRYAPYQPEAAAGELARDLLRAWRL